MEKNQCFCDDVVPFSMCRLDILGNTWQAYRVFIAQRPMATALLGIRISPVYRIRGMAYHCLYHRNDLLPQTPLCDVCGDGIYDRRIDHPIV